MEISAAWGCCESRGDMQKALNCMPGTWQTQYLRVIITFIIRYPRVPTSCHLPLNSFSAHCSLTGRRKFERNSGILLTDRDRRRGPGSMDEHEVRQSCRCQWSRPCWCPQLGSSVAWIFRNACRQKDELLLPESPFPTLSELKEATRSCGLIMPVQHLLALMEPGSPHVRKPTVSSRTSAFPLLLPPPHSIN